MCGHDASEDAVADVYVLPVVEAQPEEEFLAWIYGEMVHDYTGQMQHRGIEYAACGDLVGSVGAVVVHEALELLDGGGQHGARRALSRGERAVADDSRRVEGGPEEVEDSRVVEGALKWLEVFT